MGPEGIEEWVSRLAEHGQALSLVLLFLTAGLEYVFPPFPGDALTLAGAVLATLGAWNLAALIVVVTAGSVLGAWVAFVVGKAVGRRGLGAAAGMERVLTGYRRYGPVFLVANRFLPGIRPLFLVAAGMAGMRTGQVLLWAAVSALAWNGLLVVAGVALARNLPALETLLASIGLLAWVLVGLAGAAAVLLWLRKKALTRGR
jgi:membrane protein DedA with SNARE-associated domain